MERIGRYQLVRRLGAGSFATVWLGHDADLDVDVAVKVLAENWSLNDDVRNRFLAEARLMRRIRDPRVVQVHDIGTLADGRPYFVMDFCDAGSLSDVRANPSDPALTLHLCAESCRALSAVHRHNVVHRDVTPGNLLLHREGDGVRVALADLGVAKEMVEQAGATMTAGTPAYMAPEQAMGGRFDHRADIYSMACVVYAVLSGNPPFPVRTINELLARPADAAPPPLAGMIGAPPQLDALLAAALSVDPAQRPGDAMVMADELDRFAEQTASSAHVFSRAAATPTRVRPRQDAPGSQPATPTSVPPMPAGPSSPVHPGTPAPQPVTSAPSAPAPNAHPSGISQPNGPMPGQRPSTPAWQFWTLMGLIGALVFLGVLLITLAILT